MLNYSVLVPPKNWDYKKWGVDVCLNLRWSRSTMENLESEKVYLLYPSYTDDNLLAKIHFRQDDKIIVGFSDDLKKKYTPLIDIFNERIVIANKEFVNYDMTVEELERRMNNVLKTKRKTISKETISK